MTRSWWLLLSLLAGCAKNSDAMYANLSAGGTGCEPGEMTISADATPYAWKVSCKGKTFSCTDPKGAPAGVALCVAE